MNYLVNAMFLIAMDVTGAQDIAREMAQRTEECTTSQTTKFVPEIPTAPKIL